MNVLGKGQNKASGIANRQTEYAGCSQGFEEDETYTDSRALFEGLWQEWLDLKLHLMAKGTPFLEKGYKGAFESLPEEKQSILIGRKADFAERAGIDL